MLDDSWMSEVFDADSLMESVWFFAPWLYALLYIIVASEFNGNRRSRVPVFLVNMVVFVGYFVIFRDSSLWSTMFNFLLAIQASFATSNHNIFNDVAAIGALIVSLVFGTLMIRDLFAQLLMGILVLACFIVLFYRKITHSRKEDLFNTLSMLLTLKMCADYTQLVFDRLMIDNPGTLYVRHFVYAMVPWSGRYTSFFNNMCYSSSQLAVLFIEKDVDSENHINVFLIGLFTYMFAFMLLRSLLGLIVLKRLHVDFNIQLIWTGFYSYSIDVFNPFKVVFIGIMKKEPRMLWYALIMCAFNIGEFFNSREFLLLRCFLMFFDYLVVDSGLAGAYRFLDYDIDLSGLVFEKPGAFPYFFIDSLVDVKKHCVQLFVQTTDNEGDVVSETSGVGLIRHNTSGSRLFTVRHVLDMKNHIHTTDGLIDESVGTFDVIGDSDDPPISMPMKQRSEDGCTVRDISPTELLSIKYLFVVSPQGAISPIHDWELRHGDIHAAVNLRSGDSGSPVCAILSNGTCVLAGAVSRGNAAEGSKNLISAIKQRRRLSGSPGIVHPYHDVEGHILNDNSFKKLIDVGFEAREALALFYDEFPNRFECLDFQRQEQDPPPWQDDQYADNPEEHRRSAQSKIKSWKKKRANAKRRLSDHLDLLHYDNFSKQAFLDFADGGDIVRFNVLRKKPKRY